MSTRGWKRTCFIKISCVKDFSFNFADVVKDVRVSCNSEDITLTISTYLDQFNGLVYPKGLSKNSTCMTEYIQEGNTITYVLTLRSCNTMSTDVVSYSLYKMPSLTIPSAEWDSHILLAKEECLPQKFREGAFGPPWEGNGKNLACHP